MRAVAAEWLNRMEAWMKEIGLVMNIQELGVTEELYQFGKSLIRQAFPKLI